MITHVRRLTAVLLSALVLLAVPQIAHAAFTGRTAPQQVVSTARLVEPTNLSGTYSCSYGGRNNSNVTGVTVNINSFTDSGPAGATYDYRLTYSGVVLDSERRTARSATLSYSDATGVGRPATVQLTIRATLSNWTGPWLTRDLTCS